MKNIKKYQYKIFKSFKNITKLFKNLLNISKNIKNATLAKHLKKARLFKQLKIFPQFSKNLRTFINNKNNKVNIYKIFKHSEG